MMETIMKIFGFLTENWIVGVPVLLAFLTGIKQLCSAIEKACDDIDSVDTPKWILTTKTVSGKIIHFMKKVFEYFSANDGQTD